MEDAEFPKLRFEHDYDERLAHEARLRGHLGGVAVELLDGSVHPVFFYDSVRLAQDLDTESGLGRPFVAEKGMIVLKEITLENMAMAVRCLYEQGFFERR